MPFFVGRRTTPLAKRLTTKVTKYTKKNFEQKRTEDTEKEKKAKFSFYFSVLSVSSCSIRLNSFLVHFVTFVVNQFGVRRPALLF